ncbi:hypothetical protein [Allosphingosinicella sp.]
MESEHHYYVRRAQEHRRFAEMAASDVARLKHLKLAELLAARARPGTDEA